MGGLLAWGVVDRRWYGHGLELFFTLTSGEAWGNVNRIFGL